MPTLQHACFFLSYFFLLLTCCLQTGLLRRNNFQGIVGKSFKLVGGVQEGFFSCLVVVFMRYSACLIKFLFYSVFQKISSQMLCQFIWLLKQCSKGTHVLLNTRSNVPDLFHFNETLCGTLQYNSNLFAKFNFMQIYFQWRAVQNSVAVLQSQPQSWRTLNA